MDLSCASAFSPAVQAAEIVNVDIQTVVAESDGRLVAFAQVHLRSKPPACVSVSPSIELCRIYVERRFHETGLARDLIAHVFETTERYGAAAVWLGVWEHNPRAIRSTGDSASRKLAITWWSARTCNVTSSWSAASTLGASRLTSRMWRRWARSRLSGHAVTDYRRSVDRSPAIPKPCAALRPCRTARRPAETADKSRLKSIGAIRRREFAPRDPERSNEVSRCMPRWQVFASATTRVDIGRVRAERDFRRA